MQWLWLALNLSIFVVPLGFLGFLLWQVRRKRRVLPIAAPLGNRTASATETIALGGLSLSMFTLLALYRSYDGVPYPLSELAPASARQEYWLMLAGWTVVITGALAVAWFQRTFVAALSLFVFFCIAGYAVNAGLIFSHQGREEEIRAHPVKLIVKLKGDVAGADVWFNGVHIGKTPIEADLDQVLNDIPNWNDSHPQEFRDFKHFLSNKHGTFRPRAWFHVNAPKRVGFHEEGDESRAIFARVELDGELLYANGHHDVIGGSRIFGQIQPCSVTIDMFLPQWQDDIKLLMNRARLYDYVPDRAWVDAMATYGDAGWLQLRMKSLEEDGFNRVLDAWASHLYDVDSVNDARTAWKQFERIRSEANEQGGYYTDTPLGRALELLLPKIDREELIQLAEDRIRSFRTAPSGSLRHGMIRGRFHFGTYGDGSWERAKLTPADAVLAHAIWRLDVAFDEEDDSTDNPVEERIVPALLRLSARRGTHFNMTQALGGSIFERFVLRHNWRTPAENLEDYNDKVRLSMVEINRWLHVCATLRSPAGFEFRRKNQHRLLEATTKMVRESSDFRHSWTTNSIDFLFLDVESGPENLATTFWPSFDRYTTPERHSWSQASEVRWKYLARLQPHCKVEDFVRAYKPYCDHRCTKTPLTLLEPDLQFEVLTALVEESDRLVAEAKPESSPYYIRQANHDDFGRMARQVPCDASVKLLLSWLSEEGKEYKQRIEGIKRAIDQNVLPDGHLRALAIADDARLRTLVLPAIEQHPTVPRREMLARLVEDDDSNVRQQAIETQDRLEALKKLVLPKRDA
jgi:hypothetical protein